MRLQCFEPAVSRHWCVKGTRSATCFSVRCLSMGDILFFLRLWANQFGASAMCYVNVFFFFQNIIPVLRPPVSPASFLHLGNQSLKQRINPQFFCQISFASRVQGSAWCLQLCFLWGFPPASSSSRQEGLLPISIETGHTSPGLTLWLVRDGRLSQ